MKQLRPKSDPPPMPLSGILALCVAGLVAVWILLPVVVLISIAMFELNCELWSLLLDLITN